MGRVPTHAPSGRPLRPTRRNVILILSRVLVGTTPSHFSPQPVSEDNHTGDGAGAGVGSARGGDAAVGALVEDGPQAGFFFRSVPRGGYFLWVDILGPFSG